MLTDRNLGKAKAALAMSTPALTTTVAVASTLSIHPAWPLPDYAQTTIIPGNLDRDVGFNFAVADLNEDGRPDIATITFDPLDNFFNYGAVSVYLQDAAGAFSKNGDHPINQRTHLTVANRNFIAADFNEDGRVDLIADDFGGSDLMLLLDRGAGTFQAPTPLGLSVSERFVAAGDVNGDHHLDLLTAEPSGGMSLFLGRGNGTFYQSPILATSGETGFRTLFCWRSVERTPIILRSP